MLRTDIDKPSGDIATIRDAITELGGDQPVDELLPTFLAAPLPIYTLNLVGVLEGSLAGATMSGWRYLLLRENSPIAAAEVEHGEVEGGEFSHFEVGPSVQDTVEALRVAEEFAHGDVDFAPRFLKIPSLHVSALWLKSAGEDAVVPLPSPQKELTPFQVYIMAEFLAAALPGAERQRRFSRPD